MSSAAHSRYSVSYADNKKHLVVSLCSMIFSAPEDASIEKYTFFSAVIYLHASSSGPLPPMFDDCASSLHCTRLAILPGLNRFSSFCLNQFRMRPLRMKLMVAVIVILMVCGALLQSTSVASSMSSRFALISPTSIKSSMPLFFNLSNNSWIIIKLEVRSSSGHPVFVLNLSTSSPLIRRLSSP